MKSFYIELEAGSGTKYACEINYDNSGWTGISFPETVPIRITIDYIAIFDNNDNFVTQIDNENCNFVNTISGDLIFDEPQPLELLFDKDDDGILTIKNQKYLLSNTKINKI